MHAIFEKEKIIVFLKAFELIRTFSSYQYLRTNVNIVYHLQIVFQLLRIMFMENHIHSGQYYLNHHTNSASSQLIALSDSCGSDTRVGISVAPPPSHTSTYSGEPRPPTRSASSEPAIVASRRRGGRPIVRVRLCHPAGGARGQWKRARRSGGADTTAVTWQG